MWLQEIIQGKTWNGPEWSATCTTSPGGEPSYQLTNRQDKFLGAFHILAILLIYVKWIFFAVWRRLGWEQAKWEDQQLCSFGVNGSPRPTFPSSTSPICQGAVFFLSFFAIKFLCSAAGGTGLPSAQLSTTSDPTFSTSVPWSEPEKEILLKF